MARGKRRRAGNAMIEFVLVGIPVIFLLISIFEMARGMWLYHTLAYAMRDGARFAIVRANNCNLYPNNCVVTIRDIATRIQQAGVGFVPAEVQNVVFDIYDSTGNQVIVLDSNGNPVGPKTVTCPTLQACLDPGTLGDTYWPANAPGLGDAQGANQFINRIEISGIFPFQSAISMFWPGAKGGPVQFGTFWFPASSREAIQF